MKRRWVCAAYALGLITTDDLLDMHRDAFSRVDINNIMRNGKFLLGPETVKYVLSRENSNNTVKEFLGEFDMGRNIIKGLKPQEHIAIFNIESQTAENLLIEESMKLLNQADEKYRAGKLKKAIELYEKAIKVDPDNMEAYSSLALVYKRLGDQDKSIEYYIKCTETVKECNDRMNANKSLLHDYEVKASSYYNAGMAREEIAKIYEARGDKENARKNYERAFKNYNNALWNYEKQGNDDRINTYEKAMERMEKKVKEFGGSVRRLSFVRGQEKVTDMPMQAIEGQMLSFKLINDVNSMA